MPPNTTDTCATCKAKMHHWKTTHTLDNAPQCNTCYNIVAHELGVGNYTLEEALEVFHFKAAYNDLIDLLIQRLRKRALATKQTVYVLLKGFEQQEEERSLAQYQKERWCLTDREHYAILQDLIRPLKPRGDEILGPNNGQESINAKKRYLDSLKLQPRPSELLMRF